MRTICGSSARSLFGSAPRSVAIATLAVSALTFSANAHAQSLLGFYNASGYSTTSSAGTLTASNVASGLTFGDLMRGAGLGPTAAGNSYNSSGFASGTTLTLSNNDYLTFTVTNNSPTTQTLSFSSIMLSDRHSATGPQNLALFSSITGFAAPGQAIANWALASTNTNATTENLDISGISALQLVSNSSVEFRIYGYNAGGTAGTYRIDGTGTPTGLQVIGSLMPTGSGATPEPGSLALFLLSGAPIAGVAFRRRRAAKRN